VNGELKNSNCEVVTLLLILLPSLCNAPGQFCGIFLSHLFGKTPGGNINKEVGLGRRPRAAIPVKKEPVKPFKDATAPRLMDFPNRNKNIRTNPTPPQCKFEPGLSPAPKEPPHSQPSTKHNSRKTATDNSSAQGDVEHLHAVASPAAVDEAVGVVGARELAALGHGHLKEVAQRLPPFAHLVLEQVLGGHQGADLGVVLVEAALAVLLEVAFPEFGPEFCEYVRYM
jgi:hypothetical protein